MKDMTMIISDGDFDRQCIYEWTSRIVGVSGAQVPEVPSLGFKLKNLDCVSIKLSPYTSILGDA